MGLGSTFGIGDTGICREGLCDLCRDGWQLGSNHGRNGSGRALSNGNHGPESKSS